MAQALYVGGFDLSGDTGAINTARMGRALQEDTGIDKSAMERICLLADGELSYNCFFNDATDKAHDAHKDLPITDRLMTWLTGLTLGDSVLCLLAKQIDYNWTRPADGSLLGTVQGLGSGFGLEDAILLMAKAQHTGATDETGIQDAAAQTANGGIGFLQHFVATGNTVEYDIYDSANSTTGDDGDWVKLIEFNDVATPWAQIAQRLEVTGPVDKWVRISTGGAFTTATLACAFRRGLAVDDIDRT
jgi:hypothetical protein